MAFSFRSKYDDNEEKPDRYLITYADLITLLLGLFVILYGASQVDEAKYKELSKAFSKYFKSKDTNALTGSNGVLDGYKGLNPEPISAENTKKSLNDIYKDAKTTFNEYIEKGSVTVTGNGKEIVLSFADKLLFQTAKADIQPEGRLILDSLAGVLKGIEYQISVDGHTDNTPIKTFRYESNWHLSLARAMNVGYLLIQSGVPENNIVIRGFGEQRPVADNSAPEGKSKNRRVEVIIGELPQNALTTKGYSKQQLKM